MTSCRSGARHAHIVRRWTSPPTRRTRERGSAAVELVILVPVLLLLVLVVVFAGRLAQANTTVRHVADEAARAASQASNRTMASRAREVAFEELDAAGLACGRPAVSVALTRGDAAESVVVTVTCELNRQALAPLAPGAQTISARSAEVIDVHRGDGL